VSVSDTTAEITIVVASVTANSRNRRPTTSLMNNSGISTAISDTVNEMIVKPICCAPLSAAWSGLSPSSR
jgi:putative lipase involved disintegration of autophagic bodies